MTKRKERRKMREEEKAGQDICSVVAFIADGSVIASGYDSGVIRLWKLETKKELLVLHGHKDRVNSLVFSPDGKILASGSSDRKIILWDPFRGEIIKTLKGHGGAINSLTFNKNGTLLASGSSDKRIRIWSAKKNWKKIKELKGHDDSVYGVKFSPDDKLLASASWDHSVRLWEPEEGKLIMELTGHFGPVYDLDFSPNGKTLVTCSSDGIIKLWDLEKGIELKQLASLSSAIWSVAFHPKRKLIASGSTDHLVRLLAIETGRVLKTLKGHKELVTDVVFSPNGELLLSSSLDGSIQIWNVDKLLEEKTGVFSKAREAIVSGGIKRFVGEILTKSKEKIRGSKEQMGKEKTKEELRKKMLEELPEIISLIHNGDELKVTEIQERYNCDQRLVEEVIIKLLKEEKITGSFNPFSGVFMPYSGQPSEIIQTEDPMADLVELDQTCFYCGNPITVDAKFCPACHEEVAVCPVCKLSINFDESVGVCVYCGSKGHLNHMREAVKVTGFCPVCHKSMDWNSEITEFKRSPSK